MRKRLLAYRKYMGLGDWIMAMSVLKMVNRQYPDIDIYVNMHARNAGDKNAIPTRLSPLIEEIIDKFDVDIFNHVYYSCPEREAKEFEYISGHMVYEKKGKFFIESMVEEFNRNTGLALKYELDLYSTYNRIIDAPIRPGEYALIQACSKKKCWNACAKDFGYLNMSVISRKLQRHINVIQIGLEGDPILPGVVGTYFSTDLETLHNLMAHSKGFIGLDGGLGVYAGVHQLPHYIIYHSDFNFNWTKFPGRRQFDGNKLPAEAISGSILYLLEEERAAAIR